jgi:hypothetical protein
LAEADNFAVVVLVLHTGVPVLFANFCENPASLRSQLVAVPERTVIASDLGELEILGRITHRYNSHRGKPPSDLTFIGATRQHFGSIVT